MNIKAIQPHQQRVIDEKTELDKRMIDELGDPLIHMVRNSVDHGVELPNERAAKGKPREGTVTLDAFHRAFQAVILVCAACAMLGGVVGLLTAPGRVQKTA